MEDYDNEELQQAFRMSLQPAPEAKRIKPRDSSASLQTSESEIWESEDARERRRQRELRAAAAEQRRLTTSAKDVASTTSPNSRSISTEDQNVHPCTVSRQQEGSSQSLSPGGQRKIDDEKTQLPNPVAHKLYNMVFGSQVSKEVLAQWCNQGLRFSPDPETSLGLVQREGGPCGVLAPIQATLLKYLLFVHEEFEERKYDQRTTGTDENNLIFSDALRTRALVRAMGEILWRAGGCRKAVVATLEHPIAVNSIEQDKVMEHALDGVKLGSADELHKLLRVSTATSLAGLHRQLQNGLAVFVSRMGALLFLFSALLSRGLDAVQNDRDDPEQLLVTAPFGHASQEIVNLLLCGEAVSNVFDGNYELGSDMCLKGIPRNVEVGFLTLMESLNFCKVGQRLKCPKWPIWVLGSESHYTVLFALNTNVQDENELEVREASIRRAFDSQDQSGGGGFISQGVLPEVLAQANLNMPQDMVDNLRAGDIIVWNDFWQALLQVDKSRGGLKDDESSMGKKVFELYHFNGIAKTVTNVSAVDDVIQQRPRLTKLRVSVPPKWTPDSMLLESAESAKDGKSSSVEKEPAQHAPLVDCIRTRWQRATCNWSGDAPSIV